jgi:hypothetical protein
VFHCGLITSSRSGFLHHTIERDIRNSAEHTTSHIKDNTSRKTSKSEAMFLQSPLFSSLVRGPDFQEVKRVVMA